MPAKRRKPRHISGICMAGSPESPRIWYRNLGDGTFERFQGRFNPNPWAVANGEPRREFVCNLRQRDPLETCRSCVAYRSRTTGPTMIADLPSSLRESEWELMVDDPDAFYARLDSGHTVSTLARWYSEAAFLYEEVAEYRRQSVKRWRATHPGADKRKRDRAAYMREYRKRNPKGPLPSRGTG